MSDDFPRPIVRQRRVTYDLYANFPTDNKRGDLAFATDRLVLYRWSGTAWQAITFSFSSGATGAKPTAADLPNGSMYFDTTLNSLDQVQAGAWVAIVLPSDIGEGHITILPINYASIGQGTWVLAIEDVKYLQGVFYNTSNTNGDNISYKAYLAAGTYSLRLLLMTNANGGIIDVDIDGGEVASFDSYSGSAAQNVFFNATGITVAVSGLKTLRFRVDGKNASGTDYYAWLTAIALWRTA